MHFFHKMKQSAKKVYLKMAQHKGDPKYIARGVASGLFIGFLIPMGLQILVVIPFSFITKGSKFLAIAFTFVTNPVTVIFIYPIQIYLGSLILLDPMSDNSIKNIIAKWDNGNSTVWQLISDVLNLSGTVILSFLIGGAIFGVIAGTIGYFASKYFVIAMQKKRAAFANNRLKKKQELEKNL